MLSLNEVAKTALEAGKAVNEVSSLTQSRIEYPDLFKKPGNFETQSPKYADDNFFERLRETETFNPYDSSDSYYDGIDPEDVANLPDPYEGFENKNIETPSEACSEYPSKFERPENTRLQLQVDAENLKSQRTEVIDGKTHYYDDNGILYRVDHGLLSNNHYEINGYKYETDEKSRISSVEGELHLKDREGRLPIRDSIENIGKGDHRENDDRGHLIGDQFDGSNGLENMIPQDAEINRNDFRNFENQLADEVKIGKSVSVKIEPIFEKDSHRPSDLVVTYNIDGKENVRIFHNSKEDL